MAKQATSNTPIDGRQSIVMAHSPLRKFVFCWMPLTMIIFAAVLPASRAESLASKNKEGNRLFAQGKFEDSEKAYLEAQGTNPGKPEILYNLGNSLIKQKKYDQGIQSLRQSMNSGGKGIKENSWYNAGNALFSMDKFKDAAESYVQALKLDPADREAKHNLELALLKLKQQESQQNSNSRKNQESSRQNPSGNNKEDKQQANNNDRKNSGAPKDQNEPMKQPSSSGTPREGSISREQALQMLDALQNRELEDQRKLLERRATQRINKKDW
jgi:Ca-activated chloride channel homolog